jgi:hypothetical protein
MVNGWEVWDGLEGNIHDQIEVVAINVSERTEKNHDNLYLVYTAFLMRFGKDTSRTPAQSNAAALSCSFYKAPLL